MFLLCFQILAELTNNFTSKEINAILPDLSVSDKNKRMVQNFWDGF